MHRHRIYPLEDAYRLPEPASPPPTVDSFIACPIALSQMFAPHQRALQSAVYQLALEQVREGLRPSLVERDLLGVWN